MKDDTVEILISDNLKLEEKLEDQQLKYAALVSKTKEADYHLFRTERLLEELEEMNLGKEATFVVQDIMSHVMSARNNVGNNY